MNKEIKKKRFRPKAYPGHPHREQQFDGSFCTPVILSFSAPIVHAEPLVCLRSEEIQHNVMNNQSIINSSPSIHRLMNQPINQPVPITGTLTTKSVLRRKLTQCDNCSALIKHSLIPFYFVYLLLKR